MLNIFLYVFRQVEKMKTGGVFGTGSASLAFTTGGWNYKGLPLSKSLAFFTNPGGFLSCKLRSGKCIVKASYDQADDWLPICPYNPNAINHKFWVKSSLSHPHLLLQSVNWELENLQRGREGLLDQSSQPNTPPQDNFLSELLPSHPYLLHRLSVLYNSLLKNSWPPHVYCREIYKPPKGTVVKVEDIIYRLVVHKFLADDISIILNVSDTLDPEMVDFLLNQKQKVKRVHSPGAFEMILSHISAELEQLVAHLDPTAGLSKFDISRVYATSVKYGYFLKRIDEAFGLLKSTERILLGDHEDSKMEEDPFTMLMMKQILPSGDGYGDVDGAVIGCSKDSTSETQMSDDAKMFVAQIIDVQMSDAKMFDAQMIEVRMIETQMSETPMSDLKSYMMKLDAETLESFATIRSVEAASIIERRTQQLFRRPDVKENEAGFLDTSDNQMIPVTESGLRVLLLEAVTYGSFLWDGEEYVKSRYYYFKS